MKIKLLAFLIFAAAIASGQTTPNIGLSVPAYGTQGWNTLLNNNFSALDLLLSGNSTLPALNVSGSIQTGNGVGGQIQLGGLMGVGSAPTCTFTSGGGTGPTCTLNTGSTNLAGNIILHTGTGSPGGSGLITLTFNAPPFGTNAPVCMFRASNNGVSNLWNGVVMFTDQSSTTTADETTYYNGTGPTPLAASTTYWLAYHCIAD
jgi:hypothetical protein